MISVGEEHVDKQAATATVAAIAKKKANLIAQQMKPIER
jgi:hypothetical protein